MFKFRFHVIIYRYEIILALIVLLLTGGIAISSKDRIKNLYLRDPSYPYCIALTFDDGPHPEYTGDILSALRQNNVPATFFLVGRLAMEYPGQVEMLSLSGHEIEAHGFTHKNLTKLTAGEFERELIVTRGVIEEITGKKVFFFRPPGGKFNETVIRNAGSLGFSMVLWTVFPRDHEEEESDMIVRRVLAQASDGGVILLHSGRKPTLAALPVLIKELKARGYQFVTVSQLRYSMERDKLVWLKGSPR